LIQSSRGGEFHIQPLAVGLLQTPEHLSDQPDKVGPGEANEQIEEESNTDRVVRQLEMVGDSREGLFMLDRELGTRIFVASSPFDPAAYNLLK
jgi:hypothetical protein